MVPAMTDACSGGPAARIEASDGSDTAPRPGCAGSVEGEVWRSLLHGGTDTRQPVVVPTAQGGLMHMGGLAARTELTIRGPQTLNSQVGLWALDSLGEADPEDRRCAAEALAAVVSYEDPGLAREWVLRESALHAFGASLAPNPKGPEDARRFGTALAEIQAELKAVCASDTLN